MEQIQSNNQRPQLRYVKGLADCHPSRGPGMGVHSAASFLILVTDVSSRLEASPWVQSHICKQSEANFVHLHGKSGGVEGRLED